LHQLNTFLSKAMRNDLQTRGDFEIKLNCLWLIKQPA
jgi:hypothetical protein